MTGMPTARRTDFVSLDPAQLARFLERLPSLPKRAVRRMPKAPRRPPALSTLTPRQREVLELLAQGRSNREIGQILYRSEHTVHRHVANVLRKLGVSSRAAAVAQAARRGLLS